MLESFVDTLIDSVIVENIAGNVADAAIREIAKTVSEECLSIAVIEGILERAQQRVKKMSIASFQRYLGLYKK